MGSAKKSLVWARAGCVVVTAAAMFVLFRKINLHVLIQTFRTMRLGWYAVSFALYGLLFLPAAWRWHLALRLNDTDVRFAATTRLSLIGHFFYTILFGAAGGDTAKCALYARWYKLPMPEVLVAASLDRLMGSGGLFLFAAAALCVAVAHGGFVGVQSLSFSLPWRWVLLAVALAIVILLLIRKTRRESVWARFVNGFLISGRKLLSSPGTIVPGVLCGLLVQMALSGVLAMNLQAVSHEPVPWLKLAWTFPAISVISALPISIAGLGVRDSAALMLLGLFGVPDTAAVAASLLTASISLGWAVIDGLLLWHESNRQRDWQTPKTISVIPRAPLDRASLAEIVKQSAGDVVLFPGTEARLSRNAAQAIFRVLRDSSVAGGTLESKLTWRPSISPNKRTTFVRREALQAIATEAGGSSSSNSEFFRQLRKDGRWVSVRTRASVGKENDFGEGNTPEIYSTQLAAAPDSKS